MLVPVPELCLYSSAHQNDGQGWSGDPQAPSRANLDCLPFPPGRSSFGRFQSTPGGAPEARIHPWVYYSSSLPLVAAALFPTSSLSSPL